RFSCTIQFYRNIHQSKTYGSCPDRSHKKCSLMSHSNMVPVRIWDKFPQAFPEKQGQKSAGIWRIREKLLFCFKVKDMLGKTTNKNQPVDAASVNLIGNGTKIVGDITSAGDVRIDGHLMGNIEIAGKFVLGASG